MRRFPSSWSASEKRQYLRGLIDDFKHEAIVQAQALEWEKVEAVLKVMREALVDLYEVRG